MLPGQIGDFTTIFKLLNTTYNMAKTINKALLYEKCGSNINLKKYP